MQRIVSFAKSIAKSMPNGKKAPVKRSTKSTAAQNDAQLDTRADGVHTARVGDRTADHLNNRIFFRLFQVGNTLQRQAVKELSVTTVQWAVLGALSDPRPRSGIKSGISLSTLADFLVVSRQNLDGVLKRLERDGLVERVMDDGDKRARVVKLTPHGLLFWTDLQKRIYQFYAQAASTFRFDERVALVHYLNSLQRELMKVRLEKPQGSAVKKNDDDRAARVVLKPSSFEARPVRTQPRAPAAFYFFPIKTV